MFYDDVARPDSVEMPAGLKQIRWESATGVAGQLLEVQDYHPDLVHLESIPVSSTEAWLQ